jgi:hypothetical protein
MPPRAGAHLELVALRDPEAVVAPADDPARVIRVALAVRPHDHEVPVGVGRDVLLVSLVVAAAQGAALVADDELVRLEAGPDRLRGRRHGVEDEEESGGHHQASDHEALLRTASCDGGTVSPPGGVFNHFFRSRSGKM